ncbi:MAG TPA: redoxin domain-containing protein, partial [Thermoanaerobaculia bacterium]|nr:redoxin domain-containing protein [Thermoanaerobaculia bacterium]
MKTLLRSLTPVLVAALTAVLTRSAAATPPAVGSAAPAVSLQSQEGKTITLDQNKGKWVVLYFYPKDFTSGCT